MTRVFLLDGLREVDAATPVLRADDLGVARGESVFETTRIVSSTPCHLDEHLSRLAVSASRVDITLPGGWRDLALLASVGVEDAALRLTCSKGGVGFAVVSTITPEVLHGRTRGVRVLTMTLGITAALRADAPWLLGGVKSTSYAVNMATLRHAHAEGADDAIWVSTDGYVLEAPTATVAALIDGVWVTPPASVGILPGVTVAVCSGMAPFETRLLTVEDLRRAAEVVLLSSVRGVAPVVWLDGRELGIGAAGAALQQAYEASLRG